MDPEESLSDWTISVVSSPDLEEKDFQYLNRNGNSNRRDEGFTRSGKSIAKDDLSLTKIYFVHRAQLAVGPRKSEFFSNLFRREKSKAQVDEPGSEASRNYTKIELIPSAASCFPIMLDYMYSNDSEPLGITTDSAVALRRLASTFGMRSMFKETTQFIQDDLTPETAPTYLLDAKKFKNRKLKDSSIHIIASNFLTIKFSSLVQVPLDLMEEIIQSEHLHKEDDEKFSVRIAAYCRCREDELDLGVLISLTNESIFSTVDETESLYFLHLLFECKAKDRNAKIESTNLYHLCMWKIPKVIANLHVSKSSSSESIDKSTIRKQKKDLEYYHSFPAEIKVQLLENTFSISQSPVAEINVKQCYSSNIDRKATKQVDMLKNEVHQLQRSYEKKVNYYQRMLDAKVEELKQYSECKDQGKEALMCSPINILRKRDSSGFGSKISDIKDSSMS